MLIKRILFALKKEKKISNIWMLNVQYKCYSCKHGFQYIHGKTIGQKIIFKPYTMAKYEIYSLLDKKKIKVKLYHRLFDQVFHAFHVY